MIVLLYYYPGSGSGSKLGENPGSGSKFYVFGSTTLLCAKEVCVVAHGSVMVKQTEFGYLHIKRFSEIILRGVLFCRFRDVRTITACVQTIFMEKVGATV